MSYLINYLKKKSNISKGLKMKAILTYILFLLGIFAFSYMLIISADSEAQIQDNREKAYQEYIQRESLKWKHYNY